MLTLLPSSLLHMKSCLKRYGRHGSMDKNYSSIGMDLWSQLGRVIAEKSFSQKWSNEQRQ